MHFPGATKLSIAFDEKSRTETGCDGLVFFADHSRRRRFGRDKYSGRDQWPGCGGRPPLEIPAPGFVLSWTTDASNTDWGWRMTVTATLPGFDPRTAPLPALEQRLYHVTEVLQEGPAQLLRRPPHQPDTRSAASAAVKGKRSPSPTQAAILGLEPGYTEEDNATSVNLEPDNNAFAYQDAVPLLGAPSQLGSYDPHHDLRGQTGQALWGFAVSSYQAAAMRFASHAVLVHVARWRAERVSLPTLTGVFGSVDGLWRFLVAANTIEEARGPIAATGGGHPDVVRLVKACLSGAGAITQELLDRAVTVLGRISVEEQDVEMACWVLEQFAMLGPNEVLDAALCTEPTFLALRRRLLLGAPSHVGRMRLLALVSSTAQYPTGSASSGAMESLMSLGETLQQLLVEQHTKEEDREAKSSYLQALVQALVSVEDALGSPGKGHGAGPWLTDVRTAVEMLREVSQGEMPLRLLMGEFWSRVRAEQSVVLQVRRVVDSRKTMRLMCWKRAHRDVYATHKPHRVRTPSTTQVSAASSSCPGRRRWR